MPKFKDLTNQKFNKLLVLRKSENIAYNSYGRKIILWECLCECGNICIVNGGSIQSGNTKTCGCFHREIVSKDITGQKFNRLLALNRDLKNTRYWNCLCDCGNLCRVRSDLLKNNNTKSCGCLQKENYKNAPSGENHPLYKHGISKEDRELSKIRLHTPEYTVWRKLVFERDNYTCQISGKTGSGLVVHHLESWAVNKELRLEISNGITLSQEIHNLFHKIYGKRNNTKVQFEEFKRKYE